MYIEKNNLEAFNASLPIAASALPYALESGFSGRTGLLTCNTKKIISKK